MIKIYTDGSCLSNPGNGGWAAIINNDGNILRISGSEKNTTNNKMELMAPIRALQKISRLGSNSNSMRYSQLHRLPSQQARI